MGDNQTLVAGGVGTAFTIALLIVYRFLVPLFNASNHKRIRSVCCGQNCVTSLDVDDTSPITHASHSRASQVTPTVVVPPIRSPTPLAAPTTRTISRD